MNTHYRALSYFSTGLLLATLATPLCAAEAGNIQIQDYTGRGFAPDLVHYQVAPPRGGAGALRVVDSSGASLPVQLGKPQEGRATLSFVTGLPAGGSTELRVTADGKGPAAAAAVSSKTQGQVTELANQLLAVRVPAATEKSFATPVAASTLPAPILAFRGPDGAWRGAGSILHQKPVKKLSIRAGESGPVFTETVYRLDYEGGGYYEATIRVTDRLPFARVREEYELGAAPNAHFWELDLSKGWQPDSAEHMFVAGQGSGPVVYPTLEAEEKSAAGGPSVGGELATAEDVPTRAIHHDSCWGSRFVSYYGIHQAAARAADAANYPVAMVAPLHKGEWRRANSLPVYVKNNQVRVRFPMDAAPISWLKEPASDLSPFSCHEHAPDWPANRGRREWALVLADTPQKVVPYGNPKNASLGYSVRALYGLVGLDRYKDFQLSWPDGKVAYPRVFGDRASLDRARAAIAASDNAEWKALFRDFYLFDQNPATATRETADVLKQLQANINYIITSLSIHHHHTLAAYGGPVAHAESVLSWPDLPEADRQKLRAQLALLCYLLVDPDVTSAGNGSHHGNPNMGVSRLADRTNLVALIPDHPQHVTWRNYTSEFMGYKMGTFMAPEGGWFEYGASYHMHGYGKLIRGMMGAMSSKAPNADELWNYNRKDLDYFLNLLSPLDSRYGSRTIPGMANSPVGQSPHYFQAQGSVAEKDPEFAAHLRWGWDTGGRMVGTGGDAITIPAMMRPEIAAKEPRLSSRSFPGFGVIFRAHQGPQETALYLRSGYLWSHWNQDQGNLTLYSKGAVLLPPQPFQYGGPRDNSFPDKNFLRFGSPTNDFPHAWADSNILDTAFGNSVDYAWSSTGFPDWYIHPGYRAGFGKPRGLQEGLGQKEGDFTWDRQIAFLKGATASSPNYFVIRDTTNGPGQLASWFNLSLLGRKTDLKLEGQSAELDTEWPTKLSLSFPGRSNPKFEVQEDELPLAVGPYSRYAGPVREGHTPSRNWVDKDGKPLVLPASGFSGLSGKEQHVSLRLQNAPGQEVSWVLYPRGAGESAPQATQLAPGVTRVVTSEGTDYVFLSPQPLRWQGENITFEGLSGAVRVPRVGAVTLVLSCGPGKVGYKEDVITSAVPFQRTLGSHETLPPATPQWKVTALPAPAGSLEVGAGLKKATEGQVTWYVVDSATAANHTDGLVSLHARQATVQVSPGQVRFVVPERSYARLAVGQVGVRGMGPFDLTFTPRGISGTVDGEVRTLVTSWPEEITRPMFHQDDVLWYAGFSDEHSPIQGKDSPLFSLALGVSAGPHQVRVGEWQWPRLPQAPERVRATPVVGGG